MRPVTISPPTAPQGHSRPREQQHEKCFVAMSPDDCSHTPVQRPVMCLGNFQHDVWPQPWHHLFLKRFWVLYLDGRVFGCNKNQLFRNENFGTLFWGSTEFRKLLCLKYPMSFIAASTDNCESARHQPSPREMTLTAHSACSAHGKPRKTT